MEGSVNKAGSIRQLVLRKPRTSAGTPLLGGCVRHTKKISCPKPAGTGRAKELMARLTKMPFYVLTRTQTLLRTVRRGLQNMEGDDQDQRLLGFLGLVVFERSPMSYRISERSISNPLTSRMAPRREMEGDELCRFFYQLRSQLLKGIRPLIAIVMASTGATSDKVVGDMSLDELDLPKTHRGETLGPDLKLVDICRLYVDYLAEMLRQLPPNPGGAGTLRGFRGRAAISRPASRILAPEVPGVASTLEASKAHLPQPPE